MWSRCRLISTCRSQRQSRPVPTKRNPEKGCRKGCPERLPRKADDAMSERERDLVGIGSMVVDLIYRTPRILGAEEKIILDRYPGREFVKKLVGGVTLNHLAWASILGLRVGIFGKQG